MFASPGLIRSGWTRITPHFVCKHDRWINRHGARDFPAVFVADIASMRGGAHLVGTPKEFFTDKQPDEVIDVSRSIYPGFEMMVNSNDQFDLLAPHDKSIPVNQNVYSERGDESGFRLSDKFVENNGSQTNDRYILPTEKRPKEFCITYAVNPIFRSSDYYFETPEQRKEYKSYNIIRIGFPETRERLYCMSLTSEVPVSLWAKSSLEIEGFCHSVKKTLPQGFIYNGNNEAIPVYEKVTLKDFHSLSL